ncbi:MAG: hypothetical protein AB7G39_14555 [Alphaproteobacteria bacterium]
MLTKTELLAEIESMVELIEAARAALQNDRMVDLSEVQDRVRNAVTSVQILPAADAQEVRPHLTTLLKEMQAFSGELQVRIDSLGDEEEPAAEDR